MPFFNFRRGGSSSSPGAASAAQPETVEVIRKRAKHRLIGAAVLVLLGVVGFPLLFDTQPRPIAMDIPIEIPGKNSVKPLTLPTRQRASAPVVAAAPASAAVSPASSEAERVAAAASLTPKEELLTDKKAIAPVPSAPEAIKNEAKTTPKAETKPAVKPAAPDDDGARARALLNDQNTAPTAASASASASSASVAGEGRVVVQVGAFADAAKAREVRLKLEKAGLKTYTQVAETKDGKRIRVRVGPFASKAEAEKAASKIKTLDLQASILTL